MVLSPNSTPDVRMDFSLPEYGISTSLEHLIGQGLIYCVLGIQCDVLSKFSQFYTPFSITTRTPHGEHR